MNNTLRIKTIFSLAWKTFKEKPARYIGITIALSVINMIIQFLGNKTNDRGFLLLSFLIVILSMVVSTFIKINTIKLSLLLVRKESLEGYTFWSFFANPKMKTFWQYIWAGLSYGIVLICGLLLLIIPGIFLGVRLQYTMFLVVDKNMTVWEAFKTSWNMTKGNFWNIFLFDVLAIICIILLFPLFFITVPVFYIAQAYLFNTLDNKVEDHMVVQPKELPTA